MDRRAFISGITLSLLAAPLAAEAPASDSGWLIGTWEGEIIDFPRTPRRVLMVQSVAPDGTAQGTFGGGGDLPAKIKVENGSRVMVISVTNTLVELVRQGDNELAGSFTPVSGTTFQIRLTKIEPPTTSLGKALVGWWEGDIQYGFGWRDDRRRTLYIDSVSLEDGRWTAKGRYGFRGRWIERVSVEIDASGRPVTIRFVEASRSVIRLQLFKDTDLVGSVRLPGAGWAATQDLEPAMHLYRMK
jgi:hypothetical protein